MLRHIRPGGGGWGDPLERQPAAVLHDVLNDKVSVQKAEELYGVMIDLKNLRRELDIQIEMRRSTASVEETEPVTAQPVSKIAPFAADTSVDEKRSTAEVATSSRYSLRYRIAVLIVLTVLAFSGFLIWIYSRSRTVTGSINSIAVLPFVNANNDPNTDYFSDGVTESIINSLSQLPQTKVLARTTVFRYKGREADPQKIGSELGVDALLTGRVSQQGDILTIQADLVRVADGSEMWGGRYSKKLADVFEVQNEIASEISEKLRGRLSNEQQKRVTRQLTSNVEAYQLYLQGRFYWNKRNTENLKKAISLFAQAIDKDPNYALAYVGLADSYALMEYYAGTRSAETLPPARAAAERALQIDESLAEAHASLGLINQYQWRWDDSEKEFKRALSLNPNYATAHQWYSSYLKKVRRFDDALNEIKRAQELDPLSSVISDNLAESYLLKNDFESAIRECQKGIDLDPTASVLYGQLGLAYLKLNRQTDAFVALEKAVETSNRSSASLSRLGVALASAGKRKEAREILRELEGRYANQQSPGFYLATVCMGLGETDQAFMWLERDFQNRSAVLPFLTSSPSFEPVRNDPRYADLVRRMGLQPK